MPWSRAFTSISTGLLFIAALAEVFINKPKIKLSSYFVCITGIVLLCLFDGLRVSSVGEWLSYFNIKLPLFLLSFAVLPFHPGADRTRVQRNDPTGAVIIVQVHRNDEVSSP